MKRIASAGLTALVSLALASCGSTDAPVSSGTAPTTPATTTPATTTPATTTPETTAPDGTVTWTEVEAYPSGFQPGCCGANAVGPTSPALTQDPAPLADGTYAFEVIRWSADEPARLRVALRSLVPCADGVAECSPQGDGTYDSGEVGFSDTSRELDLTLDDSIVVYLAGDDVSTGADAGLSSILRRTDGNGLAALMAAIADAYDTAIGTPLRSGASADEVVADLQANPVHGFSSAAERMTGQLYFTFDGAPPVLFQSVANQGAPLERSGTSALIPRTMTVEGGTTTLELYAGFRS